MRKENKKVGDCVTWFMGTDLTGMFARQAVRRRFDKRIYIPLPELKARQHMFKVPA
jgi:SpoVK/Ycf46/Vps4 family AAA+-type ATPase